MANSDLTSELRSFKENSLYFHQVKACNFRYSASLNLTCFNLVFSSIFNPNTCFTSSAELCLDYYLIFSLRSARAFADAPLAYPRYMYRLLCREVYILALTARHINPWNTMQSANKEVR